MKCEIDAGLQLQEHGIEAAPNLGYVAENNMRVAFVSCLSASYGRLC